MLLAEVSATATEYKGEKVSPNETKTKNVHLTLWASIQEFVDLVHSKLSTKEYNILRVYQVK